MTKRRLGVWLAGAACLLALPALSRIGGGPGRAERVADAVTEIDLVAAEKLLAEADTESPALSYERARLAVYRGDCDAALATLASPSIAETREGAQLKEIAEGCARATVSGFVVEDKARGVWIRFQEDADRALAPYLFDVAARARDAVSARVGVDLPRPMRIDLVRDLFSLSAVSGLPLKAAETTGTLAVARWGRIIMLSPRAAALGFPWEDTLAHEITHLIVTRATRDHAPLWLQEGMAKRLESSWRAERPFDEPEWAKSVAWRALHEGRSIGIDRLGPSIAMLPTPEAASIAFAEVTSFVEFFVQQAGEPALKLLFLDLKATGQNGADVALRSVTGYTLAEWNERWQRALAAESAPADVAGMHRPPARDLARRVRLSDLLQARGHFGAAAEEIGPAITPDQRDPSLRHRAGRALLEAGQPEKADAALGAMTEIATLHGAWFALHGRRLRETTKPTEADAAFRMARAVDPLSEDVACEGVRRLPGKPADEAKLPSEPAQRDLCLAARERPRD